MDWLTITLTVLSSNVLVIVVTSLVNRRKSSAETGKIQADTDSVRVGTALKLVDELQEELAEIRKRFQEYRQYTDEQIANLTAEARAQEVAIDNLTAKTLKYQMVLSILIMQLRQGGLEPLVDPDEIDTMKIDDLRTIAQGMSNVERRRQERLMEANND